MSFVKLDTKILRSSLWLDRDAREMFITALLLAEPKDFKEPIEQISCNGLESTGFTIPAGWYGFASASGSGIAHAAGIDRETGMQALERLCSPDPESMSSEYEGRRMIRCNGGYIILNYMRYREKDETVAERMRRYRARKSQQNGNALRVTLRHVTQAEAEAEAEAEADKENNNTPLPPKGEVKEKQATPKSCSPEAQRVVDAYNDVALERDWYRQDKVPLSGEAGDLLRKRIKDDDFMLALDRYCELVKQLDWADAKRITFFLRRQTFDKCMSGEWGPSISRRPDRPKTFEEKRDIAMYPEDYDGPFA